MDGSSAIHVSSCASIDDAVQNPSPKKVDQSTEPPTKIKKVIGELAFNNPGKKVEMTTDLSSRELKKIERLEGKNNQSVHTSSPVPPEIQPKKASKSTKSTKKKTSPIESESGDKLYVVEKILDAVYTPGY